MANKTLKTTLIIGGAISGSLKGALSTTRSGLKGIGDEIAKVDRRQKLLGQSINTFGRMGKNVDGLRAQYGALEIQANRLRVAQQRLGSVQARIDSNNARRQQLGGQLRVAVGMFGAVAAATVAPIRSAMKFEDSMLGVAKQVDGARDKTGKLTQVYTDMRVEIQRLGREIPMATSELADMVTAGARMGIAKESLIGFVRTSAKMATAFDMPAGELADSMGKIAGIFKIPITEIEGLGDAINFLDDNALSKGGDIISVMKGDLAGAAATMGLSAKNAAALASTFLTLGESAERADTAAAGMMRQLQVAKMNPKRFQLGVKLIGMTGDQLQSGMINDAQGTILDVLGRIKALPKSQQMEAVTRLFGKDWGGAIAKLANGVDEYRRQLALANGEAVNGRTAIGSMSREFQARLKTSSAQWQIAKNRVNEFAVAVGSALLPAVNNFLSTLGPVVEKTAAWAEKNPGLVRGIFGAALAVSGLRVATLGLAYAWAAVKTPILGVMGFLARWNAASAVGGATKLAGVGARLLGVFRVVGTVIAAIGGGPIALIVAALTVGALVIRKYWQPIGAWMSGLFAGIRESAAPFFSELGNALAPLLLAWRAFSAAVGKVWNWFTKLIAPVQSTSGELAAAGESGRAFGLVVGAVIGTVVRKISETVGLVIAIGKAFYTVGSVITGAFGSAFQKVRTIVGLACDWILRRLAPLMTALPMIGALMRVGAALGVSGGPALDTTTGKVATRGKQAPPLRAGSAAITGGSTQQNTFHITQQPGESSDDLARRIAAHTKRRDGVARRGRLADGVT